MLRQVFLRALRGWVRFCLHFRYRVEVRGEKIFSDPDFCKRGMLILSNHGSEIDPFIAMTVIPQHMNVRPTVSSMFYKGAFSKAVFKTLRACVVPEFQYALSDAKRKEANALFSDMTQGLENNDCFLVFPAGGLKVGAKERIGGRSLCYSLVKNVPQTEIVLVRISGLWGSRFSKALTGGQTPHFWKGFVGGIWMVIKNGLFFTPKRKVLIEFERATDTLPKDQGKLAFNRELEAFYNKYPPITGAERVGEEPLHQVRYSVWSNKLPLLDLQKEHVDEFDLSIVPNQIRQDIYYQLSTLTDRSVKDIKDSDDLVHDLGVDSLEVASLHTHLSDHYDISADIEPSDLQRVSDLLSAAIHVKKGQKAKDRKNEPNVIRGLWPEKEERPPLGNYVHKTMIAQFLAISYERKGLSCAYDAASGMLDYYQFRRAIIIMARRFQKLEGKYIAVLLPSSIGSHIAILACQLAGKVPVPLNWTIGKFFTEYAVDLLGIKHVISSEKFLSRLNNVDLGKILEMTITLESVRKDLSLKEKLSGAFWAHRGGDAVLQSFGAQNIPEDEDAVILFTSGTTGNPKGVPLTHKNILTNQTECVKAMGLRQEDAIVIALPPFHVFGFNVGQIPLMIGLRAVYSPDPLDGSQIAKEILKSQATINVMAPTFMNQLLRCATVSQLKSLRLVLSGAEKTQPHLVEYVKKLGDVDFIEGYGTTECSPVISVNIPGTYHKGVGKLLPNVKAIVIEPDSQEVLGPHKIGEICVSGPSIFRGYLQEQNNKEIFVTYKGAQYYRTGDMGYLDEEGYVFLEGRKKLAIKRGGELISLAVIESMLMKQAKKKKWIAEDVNHPPFACVPKIREGSQPGVVLFTEVDLSLDQVNSALLEAGFARIYKVNEIRKIPEIPLLRSGKIAYRELFELVANK